MKLERDRRIKKHIKHLRGCEQCLEALRPGNVDRIECEKGQKLRLAAEKLSAK